jgi:tryptophanyl-tRNA synthetase
MECKKRLIEVLVEVIGPIQKRRDEFAKDPGEVLRILQQGTEKANIVAQETLKLAKAAMRQDYF